jgi:hypothetical protein
MSEQLENPLEVEYSLWKCLLGWQMATSGEITLMVACSLEAHVGQMVPPQGRISWMTVMWGSSVGSKDWAATEMEGY